MDRTVINDRDSDSGDSWVVISESQPCRDTSPSRDLSDHRVNDLSEATGPDDDDDELFDGATLRSATVSSSLSSMETSSQSVVTSLAANVDLASLDCSSDSDNSDATDDEFGAVGSDMEIINDPIESSHDTGNTAHDSPSSGNSGDAHYDASDTVLSVPVSLMAAGRRCYVHCRNAVVNRRLTALVLTCCACTMALAVGHYRGWLQHEQWTAGVVHSLDTKIGGLRHDLITCLATEDDQDLDNKWIQYLLDENRKLLSKLSSRKTDHNDFGGPSEDGLEMLNTMNQLKLENIRLQAAVDRLRESVTSHVTMTEVNTCGEEVATSQVLPSSAHSPNQYTAHSTIVPHEKQQLHSDITGDNPVVDNVGGDNGEYRSGAVDVVDHAEHLRGDPLWFVSSLKSSDRPSGCKQTNAELRHAENAAAVVYPGGCENRVSMGASMSGFIHADYEDMPEISPTDHPIIANVIGGVTGSKARTESETLKIPPIVPMVESNTFPTLENTSQDTNHDESTIYLSTHSVGEKWILGKSTISRDHMQVTRKYKGFTREQSIANVSATLVTVADIINRPMVELNSRPLDPIVHQPTPQHGPLSPLISLAPVKSISAKDPLISVDSKLLSLIGHPAEVEATPDTPELPSSFHSDASAPVDVAAFEANHPESQRRSSPVRPVHAASSDIIEQAFAKIKTETVGDMIDTDFVGEHTTNKDALELPSNGVSTDDTGDAVKDTTEDSGDSSDNLFGWSATQMFTADRLFDSVRSSAAVTLAAAEQLVTEVWADDNVHNARQQLQRLQQQATAGCHQLWQVGSKLLHDISHTGSRTQLPRQNNRQHDDRQQRQAARMARLERRIRRLEQQIKWQNVSVGLQQSHVVERAHINRGPAGIVPVNTAPYTVNKTKVTTKGGELANRTSAQMGTERSSSGRFGNNFDLTSGGVSAEASVPTLSAAVVGIIPSPMKASIECDNSRGECREFMDTTRWHNTDSGAHWSFGRARDRAAARKYRRPSPTVDWQQRRAMARDKQRGQNPPSRAHEYRRSETASSQCDQRKLSCRKGKKSFNQDDGANKRYGKHQDRGNQWKSYASDSDDASWTQSQRYRAGSSQSRLRNSPHNNIHKTSSHKQPESDDDEDNSDDDEDEDEDEQKTDFDEYTDSFGLSAIHDKVRRQLKRTVSIINQRMRRYHS